MEDWRNKVAVQECPPDDQERLDEQWKNMSVVSRNIYQIRNERGWTQRQLALYAGIQPYQISHIEWRRYYKVSFLTLCLIARALGVTVSRLCQIETG